MFGGAMKKRKKFNLIFQEDTERSILSCELFGKVQNHLANFFHEDSPCEP